MGELRELSHTADVGFEARAETLEALFETAAEGLVRARGARAAGRDEARRSTMELERPDLERLLVAWLRELLYRAARDAAVPDPEVREVSRDGATSLRAGVRWHPEDEAGPEREIKGVTYHGLSVESDPGGWHARVVLDV